MSVAFSIDYLARFLEPTRFSNAYNFLIRGQEKSVIIFLNWIIRNILVTKLLGFDQIFIFLTPAPVVSV